MTYANPAPGSLADRTYRGMARISISASVLWGVAWLAVGLTLSGILAFLAAAVVELVSSLRHPGSRQRHRSASPPTT